MSANETIKKTEGTESVAEERRRKDFLPQYSDYYFENASENRLLVSIFILMFSGFFLGLAGDLDFENYFVNFMLFLCIGQFVVTLISILLDKSYKKKKGYYFEMTGINTDLFLRPYGVISYEAVYEAIQNGWVYYKTEGLVIGHNANRIVFHYEIGDSDAQKHVQEMYGLLQSHIPIKLPPFEARTFDLLDRRYFYKKSLKSNLGILLISLLVVIGLFAGFPIRFDGGSSMICLAVIEVVILLGWELYKLYEVYKYARLYEKNQDLLKEKFEEYPNVRFGWKYTGYIFMLWTVLLVMIVNLLIIFCF